jgi:voltage-gated sodium channel
MLRLLRLLLVLKMLKQYPSISANVNAVMSGVKAITAIGSMLGITIYVFAIFAITLFRENDPWHWRNLHHAMFTLFRCATLEDWTDVMYINMYGCDKYGYDADGMGKLCVAPHAFGFKAAAFFIGFIILGSRCGAAAAAACCLACQY